MSTHAAAADRLFAVVLAAGRSQRFGSSKQLATYRGLPLARRAVLAAEAVCGARVLLVVGSDYENVLSACAPLRGFFVVNDRFAAGMSTSIVRAMSALPNEAGGVMLVLADQPRVEGADLRRLADAWRRDPSRIVCSRFGDVLGAPAIFPRQRFGELLELRGDRGARSVIERNRAEAVAVPVEAAAVDVDTPEDLQRARQRG